jgi:hypothetical protein
MLEAPKKKATTATVDLKTVMADAVEGGYGDSSYGMRSTNEL